MIEPASSFNGVLTEGKRRLEGLASGQCTPMLGFSGCHRNVGARWKEGIISWAC